MSISKYEMEKINEEKRNILERIKSMGGWQTAVSMCKSWAGEEDPHQVSILMLSLVEGFIIGRLKRGDREGSVRA